MNKVFSIYSDKVFKEVLAMDSAFKGIDMEISDKLLSSDDQTFSFEHKNDLTNISNLKNTTVNSNEAIDDIFTHSQQVSQYFVPESQNVDLDENELLKKNNQLEQRILELNKLLVNGLKAELDVHTLKSTDLLMRKELKDLSHKLNQSENQRQNLASQIIQSKEKYEFELQQVKEIHTKEFSEQKKVNQSLNEIMISLQEKNVKINSENKYLNEHNQDIEKEIKYLKYKEVQYEERFNKVQLEFEELNNINIAKSKSIEDLTLQLADFESNYSTVHLEKQHLEKQLSKNNEVIEQLNNINVIKSKTIEELTLQLKNFELNFSTVHSERQQLEKQLFKNNEVTEQLKTKLQNELFKIEKLESQNNELTILKNQFKEKVLELTSIHTKNQFEIKNINIIQQKSIEEIRNLNFQIDKMKIEQQSLADANMAITLDKNILQNKLNDLQIANSELSKNLKEITQNELNLKLQQKDYFLQNEKLLQKVQEENRLRLQNDEIIIKLRNQIDEKNLKSVETEKTIVHYKLLEQKLYHQIETLDKELTRLDYISKSEKISNDKKIEELKKDVQNAIIDITNKNQEIEFLQDQLTKVQSDAHVLNNNILLQTEEFLTTRNKLECNLQTCNSEIKSLYEENSKLQSNYNLISSQLEKTQEKLIIAQTFIQKFENATIKVNELQLELGESETEIKGLKEQLQIKNNNNESEKIQIQKWINQLSNREAQVRQYLQLLDFKRHEFFDIVQKFVSEVSVSSTLHPLKDYFNFTEFQLEKIDVELRKTPVISTHRNLLETQMENLLEQKNFLKNAIDSSKEQMQKQSHAVQKMMQIEPPSPLPPMPTIKII